MVSMEGIFSSFVDYVFPSIHWNKWRVKHWFLEPSIKLIRRKNCEYKLGNQTTLRKFKSTSNSKYRPETAFHSNLVCQQSHTNPKQFWRWINTVKGYRNPIHLLHNCGNTITKDSEKASLFNKYFCSGEYL